MYHRVKQINTAITNAIMVLFRDLRRLMASMMLFTRGNLAATQACGQPTLLLIQHPHPPAKVLNLEPELRSELCCARKLDCVARAWLHSSG